MRFAINLFGLITLSVAILFFFGMGDCGIVDDEVGVYTLVSAVYEEDGEKTDIAESFLSGTLVIHLDGTFTMKPNVTGANIPGSRGTWTSDALTSGNDVIPYSFDGNTIEFTVDITNYQEEYKSVVMTLVWRKV